MREDILEPVDTVITPIEWAAPVVTAFKSNEDLHIYRDFKVTINPHILYNQYPQPTFEEIIEKLAGGQYFTVTDL